MARRLAYTVHVPVFRVDKDGNRSLVRTEMFARGTELPKWAVPLVGKHAYEEGEAPDNAPVNPDHSKAKHNPLADGEDPDVETPEVPEDALKPQAPADTVEPAGNASVHAWRQYAVSRGALPEDVADMSRNDLRDQYGSK